MTLTKHLLLPLLALGLLTTAQANGSEASKAFSACMDRATANSQMMNCIGEETARLDKQLNESYQVLLTLTPPDRRPRLLDAQRAWLKFRDANCHFLMDPAGGTVARLLATDCVMRMTQDRAKELTDWLASARSLTETK